MVVEFETNSAKSFFKCCNAYQIDGIYLVVWLHRLESLVSNLDRFLSQGLSMRNRLLSELKINYMLYELSRLMLLLSTIHMRILLSLKECHRFILGFLIIMLSMLRYMIGLYSKDY
jgi:hypothetical protein